MKRLVFLVFCLLLIVSLGFSYSVAIMVTGEVGGNPIYEMMVNGAKAAAEEAGFNLKVVEGGYNFADWEPNVISLASTGQYDLVVTFTEGMPRSVEKVAKMFPNQKLALLDGIAAELPNVFSLGFKDEEMTYLAGTFAGLVTTSDMPGANKDLKVGLLAGDIYPAMTDRMKPAYENGAKSINEDIEMVFSAAGSWSDPNKGEELSQAQLSQGVDIILTVAGGTGVGAIQAAGKSGNYVIGVDSNYINMAPETILACTLKNADIAMKNVLIRACKGTLPFGTSERWGIKEGAIGFTFDDPDYIKNVPQDIRDKMLKVFDSLKNGEIDPLK